MHIAELATRRPGATLLAWGAAVLVALLGLVDPSTGQPRLALDPSVAAVLPADDAETAHYREIRERFGGEDVLIVGLEADDVLTPDRLRRVAALSDELAALDFVARVESLATVLEPRILGDRLVVEPWLGPDRIADAARDPRAWRELRAELLQPARHRPRLVVDGGRGTSLLVSLRALTDLEYIERGVEPRVRETVAARWSAPDERAWLSGMPVLKAATSRAMAEDLARLLPAAVAVTVALFVVVFRSGQALALLGVMVATTLLFTFGAMGWAGHAINLNTSSVPILVIAIGCSYLVHLLFAFERARAEAVGAGREVVGRALAVVARPNLIAAATTAAGMASLLAHQLAAIRDFGRFAAVGIVVGALVSVSLAPALLTLMPAARVPRARAGARFGVLADGYVRALAPHGKGVLVLAVGSLALAGAGVARLEADLDFLGNFDERAEVRRDLETASDWLGGSAGYVVVLEGAGPGTFLDPAHVASLRGVVRWLEGVPEIGSVRSPVAIGDRLHELYLEMHPEERERPPDAARVRGLLDLVDPRALATFADEDLGRVVVLAQAAVSGSSDILGLRERIERRLATLPPPLEGRVTGDAVLVGRAIESIARGQVDSLALAVLIVLALLALELRSLPLGVLALVPNLLPVLALLGAMGWAGRPVDSSSGLLACILLGVAVDDTVHLMWRFRSERLVVGSDPEAAARALAHVAAPVLTTTVVLAAVFAMLTASRLAQLASFGALGVAGLVLAWLVDMTVTPVLCMRAGPRLARVARRPDLP